jgi:hypothetical protein
MAIIEFGRNNVAGFLFARAIVVNEGRGVDAIIQQPGLRIRKCQKVCVKPVFKHNGHAIERAVAAMDAIAGSFHEGSRF